MSHTPLGRSLESMSPNTKPSSHWLFLGFLVMAVLVVGVYRSTFWWPMPIMNLKTEAFAAEPKSADAKSDSGQKAKTTGAKKSTEDPVNDAADDKIENPFPRRFKLAGDEFKGGVEWLNTSGEITLKDLRGKVVLVDFWTYCCINCMHILPDLKFLEHKYPNELVVIGVHSAKFDNEKDSENIRSAVLRYEIEHPIINDANMEVWKEFNVRAWPTQVLVDPEGYYCGYVPGEGNREALDAVIAKVIAYHRSKGTLDETPVRFDLEQNRAKPGALRFPGKVLADEASQRLFITDSNHNRLVIATLDGQLLDVIGSGASGSADGDYKKASFFRPQGVALVGDKLYVSDTENHLLRVVDLKAKQVETLAGTGEQARLREQGGALRKTALNSPWAISHVDGTLYIAMAGPHQIWSHKLGSDEIGVFAGSGREDILNGLLNEAAFAQPSGLSSDGKFVFVADSEGSAIRKVDLGSRGEVMTLAGASNLPQGRSLFEFGDVDDVGSKARFQHPLDVLFADGSLFVADSYNHKVKKIDLANRAVSTFIGNGKAGTSLKPVRLSEPAGLSAANGFLYVADTNNHRVVKVSLKSGDATEVKLDGLRPPAPPSVGETPADHKDAIEVASQTVGAGEALRFDISFKLPKDFKLNKLAKVTYRLDAAGQQTLIAADQLKTRKSVEVNDDIAAVSIPLAKPEGEAKFTLSVSFSYCRDGVGGLCKLKTSRWSVPVRVSADGKAGAIRLEAAAE